MMASLKKQGDLPGIVHEYDADGFFVHGTLIQLKIINQALMPPLGSYSTLSYLNILIYAIGISFELFIQTKKITDEKVSRNLFDRFVLIRFQYHQAQIKFQINIGSQPVWAHRL